MRILIVDDNAAVRRGIRSLLAVRPDFPVCGEASDGAEAVEKCRELRPDVVLMDLSMPRMDGVRATRLIRQEAPETDVIIVTQNVPEMLRSEHAEIGARGFVSKAKLAQDLLPSIAEIVESRANHQPQGLRAGLPAAEPAFRHLFEGGGEMGRVMRSMDWSKTPLGPSESWSPALRMMVRFLLANRFPQLLWWGPQFCCLYNDAYIPILGAKHPWALGRPTAEVWHEIWRILKPLIETPFQGGAATWIEDFPLEINRNGFVEETHFTVAYSPVPDDTAPGSIGGVLATVHEITGKVVGERRITVLRDLGARSVEPRTPEEACTIAAQTLERHPKDVPFALLYLIDEKQTHARFAASVGVEASDRTFPRTLSLEGTESDRIWPLSAAIHKEEIQLVSGISSGFEAIPSGPWSDPPNWAAVVPVRSNTVHQPAGFAIIGISSRLQFDERYRSFLDLVSTQISITIANARTYAEERRRAEQLAQLDRAKTTFFSNISHEFRTPLTLMMGPLEDAMAQPDGLSPTNRERLQLAQRNSQRLLKLVNTLLDFSRIEAGRVQASYEPTDLALLTSELSSTFRSAIERAGMKLAIDCQALPEQIYVDREMWEKVVLNLLSNAFKFTFEGEIQISLRAADSAAEFIVRDTGTGIPADEIPRLFERFHRVSGARGRSYEGSGIGLALVQELIKLHGGSMRVESELNRGTAFIVTIPFGTDHLPVDRISRAPAPASTGLRADAYVQEALRWLPEVQGASGEIRAEPALSAENALLSTQAGEKRARILIADDNADMREYVQRLLQQKYDVVAVADGEAALQRVRQQRPDLILSDVMMPRLDGFGFLRAVRDDRDLKSIPFVLLSARAGEESRVEGLDAGADDYLVKPFSARELLARVAVRLNMARVRREAADVERRLRAEAECEVRVRTRELEERNAEVLRQSEQLRELSWHLWRMQDEERRHIARELHDSAGQTLAVLGMNLSSLVRAAREKVSEISQPAEEIRDLVEQLTKEIRTTSYLLHPPLLDENGLPAALSWYVRGLTERSDIDVAFSISDEFGRLPCDMELVVFRVVQECLTNIHRHSGSKRATIRIVREEERVWVEVRDQGKGIAPERLAEIQSRGSGVGIRGMRERLRQFAGEMILQSNSSGTTILVTIPLKAARTAVAQDSRTIQSAV